MEKGWITMINLETISAYSCQPDNEYTRWAKDENMAYCEGFAALCTENGAKGIAKIITAILTFIVK